MILLQPYWGVRYSYCCNGDTVFAAWFGGGHGHSGVQLYAEYRPMPEFYNFYIFPCIALNRSDLNEDASQSTEVFVEISSTSVLVEGQERAIQDSDSGRCKRQRNPTDTSRPNRFIDNFCRGVGCVRLAYSKIQAVVRFFTS